MRRAFINLGGPNERATGLHFRDLDINRPVTLVYVCRVSAITVKKITLQLTPSVYPPFFATLQSVKTRPIDARSTFESMSIVVELFSSIFTLDLYLKVLRESNGSLNSFSL